MRVAPCSCFVSFIAGPDIAECSYGGLIVNQGNLNTNLTMCSERRSKAQLQYPLNLISENKSVAVIFYSYSNYSSVWVNLTLAQTPCQGFLVNPCNAATHRPNNPMFGESKQLFAFGLDIYILNFPRDHCVWFHIFPSGDFNTTFFCEFGGGFKIDAKLRTFEIVKMDLQIFFPNHLWVTGRPQMDSYFVKNIFSHKREQFTMNLDEGKSSWCTRQNLSSDRVLPL